MKRGCSAPEEGGNTRFYAQMLDAFYIGSPKNLQGLVVSSPKN
jgi:hypothetical protein